jgi:hypothetical protein
MSGLHRRCSELCGIAVAIGLASCGVDKVKFTSLPDLVVSSMSVAVLEGEQATFTVALTARPAAPMLVTLRSTAEAKIGGAPAELTFLPEDFDVPQTVTISGKTDRDALNETGEIIVESEGDAVSVAVSVIECPTLAAQDFWVIFNPNVGGGRREIYVAGEPGTTVTIAGAAAAEIPAAGILVVDTGLTRVPVANTVESGKAFQVTASAPVQVFANNFLDNTVDAFTAVPVQLLGTDYRAIGYATSRQSQITVVATEDNTAVTIGAIGTIPPVTITLNRGQSYMRTGGTDATGVQITSDKPIGVNTGDACINTGQGACDHVEEMLFPVASWVSDFFIPTLPQAQDFRVVAATNGTVVTVDGVEVGPPLAAGTFYNGTGGGKRVQTSQPSQVYIVALGEPGGSGDPAFVLMPGVQNAVDKTTFSALSASNVNTLAISMPTPAIGTLRLDGEAIAATTVWTPYASGGYSYAQVPLAAGAHKLTAEDVFIPVVWGERSFESYGYVAGYGYPKQRCTLPMP